MQQDFITGKNKLEFREIVLGHVKKILEISTREFKKNNKRYITKTHFTDVVEEEDTRICYIQSVEALSHILLPYFDEQMQKKYDELIGIIEMYVHEFYSEHESKIKQIAKEREALEGGKVKSGFIDRLHILEKLRSAKELFKELNLLMRRQDYLKGVMYSESIDDTIDIDEEQE